MKKWLILDHGVIRRPGRPLVAYEIAVDPAALERYAARALKNKNGIAKFGPMQLRIDLERGNDGRNENNVSEVWETANEGLETLPF